MRLEQCSAFAAGLCNCHRLRGKVAPDKRCKWNYVPYEVRVSICICIFIRRHSFSHRMPFGHDQRTSLIRMLGSLALVRARIGSSHLVAAHTDWCIPQILFITPLNIHFLAFFFLLFCTPVGVSVECRQRSTANDLR